MPVHSRVKKASVVCIWSGPKNVGSEIGEQRISKALGTCHRFCGAPNPFLLVGSKISVWRVKSSRDQLDLCAARGVVLPSAAAIADISGFMK